MSLWDDLPSTLGANLFKIWLTTKEHILLDSACCSKSSREVYLSYSQITKVNAPIRVANQEIVQWFLQRKYNFSSLLFNLNEVPQADLNIRKFTQLLELHTKEITKLTLSGNNTDIMVKVLLHTIVLQCTNINSLEILSGVPNDLIHTLINSIPNNKITSLILDKCYIEPITLTLFNKNHNNLETLIFNSFSCSDQGTALMILQGCCKNLKNLTIMNCNNMKIKTIFNFLTNCKNLLSITVPSLSDPGNLHIYCPHLRKIYIKNASNMYDYILLRLIKHFTFLTELCLYDCINLTNHSISQLKYLNKLVLTGNNKITFRGSIYDMYRNSPDLHTVEFYQCSYLTRKYLQDESKNMECLATMRTENWVFSIPSGVII